MNKKEKYKELAQKTLRECMNVGDNSKAKSITDQTSALYTKVCDPVEDTDFKEYLSDKCPFFSGIDKEECITEFLCVLENVFEKEYRKINMKAFKPTQILAIFLVLEDVWGYSKLEKDVMKNLKNFPLGAVLVSKLYFWGLNERRLWEFCTDLNKVF